MVFILRLGELGQVFKNEFYLHLLGDQLVGHVKNSTRNIKEWGLPTRQLSYFSFQYKVLFVQDAQAKVLDRSCGLVVSMVTFYSNKPSLNPYEACSFYTNFCFKRTKINKTDAWVGPRFENKKLAKIIFVGLTTRPGHPPIYDHT